MVKKQSSFRPRGIREIQKYIKLRGPQEVKQTQEELDEQALDEELRRKQEDWESVHVPFRDEVFEDHEVTSALASESSSRAKQAWEECEETCFSYRTMRQSLRNGIEALDQAVTEKYDYEVAQFNQANQQKQIEKETAKRVSQNGGKALNYVLIPKSQSRFSRRSDNSSKQESPEEFHQVPLVYHRLAQPKVDHKIRVRSLHKRIQTMTMEDHQPKKRVKIHSVSRTTPASPDDPLEIHAPLLVHRKKHHVASSSKSKSRQLKKSQQRWAHFNELSAPRKPQQQLSMSIQTEKPSSRKSRFQSTQQHFSNVSYLSTRNPVKGKPIGDVISHSSMISSRQFDESVDLGRNLPKIGENLTLPKHKIVFNVNNMSSNGFQSTNFSNSDYAYLNEIEDDVVHFRRSRPQSAVYPKSLDTSPTRFNRESKRPPQIQINAKMFELEPEQSSGDGEIDCLLDVEHPARVQSARQRASYPFEFMKTARPCKERSSIVVTPPPAIFERAHELPSRKWEI